MFRPSLTFIILLALVVSSRPARGADAPAPKDAPPPPAASVVPATAAPAPVLMAANTPSDDVPPVLIPWPLRPERRVPGQPVPPEPRPAPPAPPPDDDRSTPLIAPPAPAPAATTRPAGAGGPVGPVPSPRGAAPAAVVADVDDEPLVPLLEDRPEDPGARVAAMRPGAGLPPPSLEPSEGSGPRPVPPDAGPRPGAGGPVAPRAPRPPGAPAGTPPVAPRPEGQPAAGAPAAAATAARTPAVTKKPSGPAPGSLTESELGLLAPMLDLPSVGARVAVTELTPPTQDVRRWQFEPIEGLTWESREASQEGDWIILRGQVDIRAGIERIRADEVKLNTVTRRLEAEGNVVLDRLDSRLTGRRLEYDVETNLGTVFDVIGYTADDLSFTADVAEKVGPDKYLLRHATFTSCTQPSPIWQIHASKSVVAIDKFVYLWNPRVAFGKIPLSYLPWVAFPIKQDRTTGFMVPRISSSSRRGTSLSEEFFWAINRSTDITLGGTWWSNYGFRVDGQARWFLPGMNEYGYIEGIYLHADEGKEDPKLDPERYLVDWEHRQSVGEWDLTVTGEIATDPLVDEFDGQLSDSGSPTGLVDRSPILNQRVTMQRRWGKHSLNVELQNDERGQVTTPPPILPATAGRPVETADLQTEGTRTRVTRQLPLAEYRASGLQLGGRKWATLSLEGSVGALTQGTRDTYRWPYVMNGGPVYLEVDEKLAWHDYMRADLYPQFRFPLGSSWFRVIPEVAMRGTWWSRLEKDANPATPDTVDTEPRDIDLPDPPVTPPGHVTLNYTLGEDESAFLWAWDAGVTFEGPDFERIFNVDATPGQRKWQHLIEPAIDYSYAPELDRRFLVTGDQRVSYYQSRFPQGSGPLVKEGGLNEARLRLVNTLRSKRVVPPGSSEEQARDLVIWTLSSNWDLDKEETSAVFDGPVHDVPTDCNGDGDTGDLNEGAGDRCPRKESTRFQNLSSDFNIRPTDAIHFALRNTYDVLTDDITDTSLVGGVGGNWGYTDLSFTSRRDRETTATTNAEVSLTGEHWFYKGGRVRLGYDLTRILEEPETITLPGQVPPADKTDWIYKRLVVSYYNQCIGLSLSWEDNAHRSVQREQEWTFIVSLKELSNFIRYRRRSTVK